MIKKYWQKIKQLKSVRKHPSAKICIMQEPVKWFAPQISWLVPAWHEPSLKDNSGQASVRNLPVTKMIVFDFTWNEISCKHPLTCNSLSWLVVFIMGIWRHHGPEHLQLFLFFLILIVMWLLWEKMSRT